MNDIYIFLFTLLSMLEILTFSNPFLEALFPMNCSCSYWLFSNFSRPKTCFLTLLKALLHSIAISFIHAIM